jgi:hypothetical protein
MRYEEIELPQEPWIIRLALAHRLTADGESFVNDEINGRRPAGTSLPIWAHQGGNEPTSVRFPDPVVVEYVSARLLPIVTAFHGLAAKMCGRLLSAPEAASAAPEGINVGLMVDLEIWAGRERPTEVEFWAETPDSGPETVRLLIRLQADAPNFVRRAFSELAMPTELTSDGRVVRQATDSPAWADLRTLADSFEHGIVEFLTTLPESE